MLLRIKEKVEIVIVINANDIQKNKIRNDIGINYEKEVLRLIDAFHDAKLTVGSVCITIKVFHKLILILINLII